MTEASLLAKLFGTANVCLTGMYAYQCLLKPCYLKKMKSFFVTYPEKAGVATGLYPNLAGVHLIQPLCCGRTENN